MFEWFFGDSESMDRQAYQLGPGRERTEEEQREYMRWCEAEYERCKAENREEQND